MLVGRTDWERLAAMSEEEIEANALSDPDNFIRPRHSRAMARPCWRSFAQEIGDIHRAM